MKSVWKKHRLLQIKNNKTIGELSFSEYFRYNDQIDYICGGGLNDLGVIYNGEAKFVNIDEYGGLKFVNNNNEYYTLHEGTIPQDYINEELGKKE